MKKQAELRAVMLCDGPDGMTVRTDCAAGREDMLILLSLLLDDAANHMGISPAEALETLGEAHKIVMAGKECTVDMNGLAREMRRRE